MPSSIISLLIQYSLLMSLTAVHGDRSPINRNRVQQELSKPIPTPTPGMGTGGNGPGGSFNVDPPEPLQGRPSGVRDITEVLNETRTSPRIPDPTPSTQNYCWPGDSACRKPPPAAKPRPAGPKPTPPPRSRPELLLASNSGYIDKLISSAMPYLSQLWGAADLLRHDQSASAKPFTSARESRPFTLMNETEGANTSYIWADCTTVQGYADGAQATVYIYVDSAEIGTTSVQGGNYFSYDISAYVNDGMYHEVSAW